MSNDPRRTVDDYLTRIARRAFPYATVTVRQESDGSKDYQIDVPGQKPFVLGTVFGHARATLRALVSEHLPRGPARTDFLFDVRVLGAEHYTRAKHVAEALRRVSSGPADAALIEKLLALTQSIASFSSEDLDSLRAHARTMDAPRRRDFDQLADTLVYWSELGDPAERPL